MEVIYRLSEIVINFIEAYIWYRLTDIFLQKKYGRVITQLGILLLWGSLCIKSISTWQNADGVIVLLLPIVCFILIIVETCVLYVDKIQNKLLISFIYIASVAIVNLLIMGVLILLTPGISLDVFSDSTIYRVESEVLGKTVLLFMIEYFAKKKNEIMSIERRFAKVAIAMICLDFILFFSVYFIYNNAEYLTSETALVFVILSIVILTGFFIFSLNRLIQSSRQVMEEKMKYQQMEIKYQLNEDMNVVIHNLRNLRHDMNNHIAIIYGLMDLKQYDRLEHYIKKIYGSLTKANDFIIVKNEALSIILNTKKTLAEEKGIDFEASIMLEDFKLSDIETCSLLGNILDNAIQATTTVESKKFIALKINQEKYGWEIQCENPYTVEPVFDKNGLVSTKENKEFHGIGTKNVTNIVEKYAGKLEYHILNGLFRVHIFIPK